MDRAVVWSKMIWAFRAVRGGGGGGAVRIWTEELPKKLERKEQKHTTLLRRKGKTTLTGEL